MSIGSPQCAHESQGLEAVLVLENSEWCELMKCDRVLSHSYSQAVSVTDILGRPDTSFCNSSQSIRPLKHLHIAHIFILFCACVFVWCSCMSIGACVSVCLLSSECKMRSWFPLSTVQWTLPRQHVSLGMWNKCLSSWPISVTQEEPWVIRKKTYHFWLQDGVSVTESFGFFLVRLSYLSTHIAGGSPQNPLVCLRP